MYQVEGEHWWFAGKRLAVAAMLEGLPLTGLAVDVGCGTGAVLADLARRGPALGVEFDARCLGLACRRGDLDLVRAGCSALPLANGSAGFITLMDVLYHEGVDVAATLAECHRVLAPGGWLLVFDSAYEGLMGPHDRAVHGARRFARRGLCLRLERAGFSVVRATYRNSLLAPLAIPARLAARWLERLRGAGQDAPVSDVDMPAPWLNRLLLGLMVLETRWLKRHDFPLGLSVCALAAKPIRAGSPAALGV
jgi:SAM-dependent methyltransferase